MQAQLSTHTTLLRGLRGGDDARAWSEFVRRYGALIRSVARQYGLQGADADDVLQDVLIGLTSAMTDFEYDPARARFRTFLQRIVERAIYRKFRKKMPRSGIDGMETLVSEQQADEIWEADWRQYHVSRAMETIEIEFSARDREIFALYVGEGRAAGDTAATLGVSIDLVYQAKSRILSRLSELVAAQIEDEG